MTSGRDRFSDRFLAELRNRVPLAGVVGCYLRLVQRCRVLIWLCPFHGERSPSFTVVRPRGSIIASAVVRTAMLSIS